MKKLIQKHKNKLLIASPILILSVIIFGAFYVMSLGEAGQTENPLVRARRDLALEQFNNLDIKAKAYVVYDSRTGKVIYSKNELTQLPLASITKIMSAVVALDIAKKDTIIDVESNSASNNPNDRAGLTPGKWRLDDLLKLTLVSSSNSGIITISGALSSPDFVDLMNKKAKALGLDQTYFLNESGLDVNESLAGAYGSPLDVARLLDYALKKNADIFGATKYSSIVINSTDGRSEDALNTNSSVFNIKNLVASKTGFTELAEGNLVIAFDVDSKTMVIVVVLGSTQEERFTDAEILSKATFAYYALK